MCLTCRGFGIGGKPILFLKVISDSDGRMGLLYQMGMFDYEVSLSIRSQGNDERARGRWVYWMEPMCRFYFEGWHKVGYGLQDFLGCGIRVFIWWGDAPDEDIS